MDYTDFVVDRAQHMRPLEYDLSESHNELVRYLHDMGVLDNVPVGTLGPAEILTASDAISAPLRSLVVGGSSTQDGTPTPSSPVPIVSTVNPIIHAGDGTTDATGWPITLPVTLRSLLNGTRDTLALTYLRPSTREGWAWYSGKVTRRATTEVINGREMDWWKSTSYVGGYYRRAWATNRGIARTSNHLQDRFATATSASTYTVGTCLIDESLNFRVDNDLYPTLADFKAWLVENPVTIQYPLATPTTETLDPIELPVLPAPNVTIYATADATPTLTAEYIRNLSASISDMQTAIADIISV